MQSTNFFRVSISNLPSTMNEEKLSKIFADIDFVKISLSKCLKGICKGYGYMDLSCEKDVKKVLELNGYVVDGKKIKIEEDKEELNELKKQSSRRESNLSQILPVEEKLNEDDPLKIRKQLYEVSHKFNKQIISEPNKNEENEICICLSSVNPQLVNEMKHLFPNLSEYEFKYQINKNDELKKIYLNCCSESHSLEEKIQKIQHLKFDENPIRDEQLKTLCCVLVKSFEDNKDIDFNICNRLSSNLKSINCFPERAIVFEVDFSSRILGEHSFKEFIMDKRKQKIIEMNLQKKIGEILDIPFGDVVFLKIREGTVRFSGIIPPKALLKKKDEQTELNEYVFNVLKKKLREGLGLIYPIKGLEMGFQTFKSKLSLNPVDFDTAGDYYFRSKSGDKQTRGGYPYYQPSKKWKRYGLRVMGVYENDDWLKMDNSPNEWAVAFHGTKTHEIKVTENRSSIQVTQVISSDEIEENLMKFGHLFVQDVEDCITDPVEWQGDVYEIAFQCRIHPDHIKETGNRTFITVDNPHFVRPYGILMKKQDLKKIK